MLVIRRLTPEDLFPCLSVDPGYQTDRVWRLTRHLTPDEATFSLRVIQLPRIRVVDGYPIVPPLDEQIRDAPFALLAEDREVEGYVLAGRDGTHAVIRSLVVDPSRRGTGVGARLLREVRQWAARERLRHLDALVESRNYPGVRFLLKHGFTIRGVRDALDRDDEVIIELSAPVLRQPERPDLREEPWITTRRFE